MGQAADIVGTLLAEGHEVAVVTSAMSGVTDLLLGSAQSAVKGERLSVVERTAAIRAKHEAAAKALGLRGDDRHLVLDPITARLGELSLLCDALGVLGEASPRALDAVGALGERMSIHLLAAALRSRGREGPRGRCRSSRAHRRHVSGRRAADGRDTASGRVRVVAAAGRARSAGHHRLHRRRPPTASSRHWAAVGATTRAPSSARPSTPTRCGSTPMWTA